LRGRRPEIVKAYCAAVNGQLAGGRFSDLKGLAPDFVLRCPEVRCYYGTDSLWTPRRVKLPVDLAFGDRGEKLRNADDVVAAWKEQQRMALTPQRAARLLGALLPSAGATISSQEVVTNSVDELLDLLAVAAYQSGVGSTGKKLKWKVDGVGRRHGLEPQLVDMDDKAGRLVARFDIRREA
jgi:hypothetical protein